jgi:hypothetical protein
MAVLKATPAQAVVSASQIALLRNYPLERPEAKEQMANKTPIQEPQFSDLENLCVSASEGVRIAAVAHSLHP